MTRIPRNAETSLDTTKPLTRMVLGALIAAFCALVFVSFATGWVMP